jgi:hypothetical protein
MKRFLVIAMLVMFVSGVCYAAENPLKGAVKVVEKAVASKVTGKVEAVSLADAAKGTKSEIVVVEKDGKKLTILVMETTPILDAAGKAITLDKIQKDEEVTVKYMCTKEGVNEAEAIHVVKK